MEQEYDIKAISEKILAIKQSANELMEVSGSIAAIECNVNRILSSVKLLELEFVDVVDILNP